VARLVLKADLRSAPDIGADHSALYPAFLDMCEWADQLPDTTAEIHCAPDGYMPSPVVTAAAILGRTRHLTVRMTLLIPFYDPIRLAEDLAVLDVISGGRMTIVLAAGYRSEEFDLFGVDSRDRGRAVESSVGVLRQAWTGEPFDYRGKAALVLPRPLRRPGIPLILAGSAPASARRAARIADGYLPNHPDLLQHYTDELARLGKGPGLIGPRSPVFKWVVAVSDDPDKAWANVAPFCLHEMNSYAEWAAKGSAGADRAMYSHSADTDSLRASGPFHVLTPEQCVAWMHSNNDTLIVAPLTGGIAPEVAWSTLRLIASHVLPAI
jgi:alkanesulfonate monooxygenase SsuD/methylene tetrahydromethanopterin reductase-like flavin-dependent oxidoreductase (luciferase family)